MTVRVAVVIIVERQEDHTALISLSHWVREKQIADPVVEITMFINEQVHFGTMTIVFPEFAEAAWLVSATCACVLAALQFIHQIDGSASHAIA